jgi:hypothetical protein
MKVEHTPLQNIADMIYIYYVLVLLVFACNKASGRQMCQNELGTRSACEGSSAVWHSHDPDALGQVDKRC